MSTICCCAVPGRALGKRRYHYAHAGTAFAIDVFEGQLDGLVLAEAEATTDAQLGFIPTCGRTRSS